MCVRACACVRAWAKNNNKIIRVSSFFFRTLGTKTTQHKTAQPKSDKCPTSHFHRFICCLDVVLSLEQGAYPEYSLVVFRHNKTAFSLTLHAFGYHYYDYISAVYIFFFHPLESPTGPRTRQPRHHKLCRCHGLHLSSCWGPLGASYVFIISSRLPRVLLPPVLRKKTRQEVLKVPQTKSSVRSLVQQVSKFKFNVALRSQRS